MNQKTTASDLHLQIISFTKRVIRTRTTLVENKASKTAPVETMRILVKLSSLIQAYSYHTNELASVFLLNHANDIRFIMPGPTSLAHESFRIPLEYLIEEATSYLNRDVQKTA